MGRKIRVFISSTMKDLANERDAVGRRLVEFNYEPVNAEGWSPTGAGSWARIEQEIESSHVFLLILGERYGWIPPEGPGAEQGLSVTHLEYRKAVELGLPVLPFLKRLAYDAERDSTDAKKRDAFRKEVTDWAQGRFVAEFELASDLAQSASAAVSELLTEDYLYGTVQARADTAQQAVEHLEPPTPAQLIRPAFEIPPQLLSAVRQRQATLFAGAGISLSAGLPSASAFAERLAQLMRQVQPDYGTDRFAIIADDVEAVFSRDILLSQVARLLDPPQGLRPTGAHLRAVKLFDRILTTNWDHLFEDAASAQDTPFDVIARDTAAPLPVRAIVHLQGYVRDPQSLLLTQRDSVRMDVTRAGLWHAALDVIRHTTLVVVGTSLRDPAIIRLFDEAAPDIHGYFVVPAFGQATPNRVRAWNLEAISATADDLLSRLATAVEA